MAKAKPRAKPKAKPKAKATAKKPTAKKAPAKKAPAKRPAGPVLRAIRSVIYTVDDLARAKQFYATALGREPYFDQPFYVGFDVDGQELGLDPDVSTRKPGPGGALAFWRVDDLTATWNALTTSGGQPLEPPHNVGGSTAVAVIADPFGNYVGLIQTD